MASSLFRGVVWDKSRGRWIVQLHVPCRRQLFVGRFDDEILAAKEYNKAATRYLGDNAKLNEV